MESSREAVHKELSAIQRKLSATEDEVRQKAREHQLMADDRARSDQLADDQRRELLATLENANTDLTNLRLELSGAHGRVEALEIQLSRVDGSRRDAEMKLSNIVSSLRRTIGFNPGETRRDRSLSPDRQRSRSVSPIKGSLLHAATL